MTKLRVSPDLSLPEDAVTRTFVVYGGKGKGKTNFGAVLCEELAARRLRFCVTDPLDVWWGLQHGKTKDGQGIDVVILGGAHGDIAITPDAGEVVADFVADETVNTVIVMRHPDGRMWTNGERVRFMSKFVRRLFARQGERRIPLMLVIDEAGRFVPQQAAKGDMQIAECIGAIEELVEWGRNVGLGVCLITQRSARMNKSVSELAECMVAFQTAGPNSVKAIVDWFGEHVETARQHELVAILRKLPVGRALVVSPEWLDFEKEAQIRLRETFDSSATPKAGGALRAPGRARKPDLGKYRERMAATIEQAKAHDPNALQKVISALRKELEGERKKQPAAAPVAPPKRVEVPVLKGADIARLERAIERGDKLLPHFARVADHGNDIKAQLAALTLTIHKALSAPNGAPSTALAAHRPARDTVDGDQVRAATPRSVLPARPSTPTNRRSTAVDDRVRPGEPRVTEGITSRQQRFLDAAATLTALDSEVTRETVAAWVGVHPRGGSVGEELKGLVDAGMIELDRGAIRVTPKGMSQGGTLDPQDAIAQAQRGLSPRQRRIFDIIVGVHPDAITREAIAESMGIHPRGGSFGEDLGRLRGRGLIEYERGSARARDFLFAGVA